MSTGVSGSGSPPPYGSAKDLPSFQEMAREIRGAKLLTLVVARDQRAKLVEVEQQLERLTRVVDSFYDRLGSRNWIFHERLDLDQVELLLARTTDAESAEKRLIDLYREEDATRRWIMGLRAHNGLRLRLHQIDRALEHYLAGQFDSCALQLIVVMDGFVNDFEPAERRGLHSREPSEMSAWDSVVGHHMGLTHAMATFTKTIKKRVDDEVFEVYRHGIIHGSVANFDNVVVATKAWNMLFALADWATATVKAAEPKESPPTWRETWVTLSRRAAYERYRRDFQPSTLQAGEPGFASNELVKRASAFLDAWQHTRWAIVAGFRPPMLRDSGSDGQAAREAKETFQDHRLQTWSVESLVYDAPSSAAVRAKVTIDDQSHDMHFGLAYWTVDARVGIPGQEQGAWSLAVWAPQTYLQTDL